MKGRDFLDFRDMLHCNKDLFKMPSINISDTQFQSMIDRARVRSSVTERFSIASFSSISSPLRLVLFSPMLAAVLIFTIITITVSSLATRNTDTYLTQNVHIIDKNTRVPIEEVYEELDN